MDHIQSLLALPGAKIEFGGDLLENHSIPECYGSWKPTAVRIPLEIFLQPHNFELCTTEIFGGFQILVEYKDSELDLVLEAIERMSHHLTAAVVSNDSTFVNKVERI